MRGLPILSALSALSALALLSLVTSCVAPPRSTVPPPTPPPVHVVAPPAPAGPVVVPTDWRDWPQTPGDWRYDKLRDGSVATFGTAPAVFALQCLRGSREIVMIHYVATGGPTTIRTSALTRVLSFTIAGDPPDGSVVTRLAATDPLLDAMAFSRGRFVVEEAGAALLVLPGWAEVGRVIEDCRG